MVTKEKDDLQEQEDKIVVGLDIGTTKICAVAGKKERNGFTQIIGIGVAPSEGLKKGIITDIGAAANSIRRAVTDCEQKSGTEIRNVYVGIAGQHLQGRNLEGVVAVKGDTISHSDVERVIESARAFNNDGKEIIHILSQEYIVDGEDGVQDPIGMAGKRLQARVHIIFGSVTAITNVYKSCSKADLNVERLVVEPLASAFSVLSKEERRLGVMLLDIGGGTTDIVVYQNGSIAHTIILPIGGDHITNDIAIGLRTSHDDAKKFKHEKALAREKELQFGDTINVPGISGRAERICERSVLVQIVEARFREIFEMVSREIKERGFESTCNAGIVLTGGSSLLNGLDLLADEVFNMPVRIAYPMNTTGLKEFVSSPIFSTAVGLINYGLDDQSILDEQMTENQSGVKTGFSLMNFFKKFL